MATYLPGVTDYIPQIQPFKPDYNFYSGALQMKQGQYDASHKQLSNLYGSLLNAPMLRDQNIESRDQFFKAINNDIQKISGLDLSLQENVSAASDLFTQIYDNENIVKDMVYTKNYQSELTRAESFRNCVDIEKCGGAYWEDGVKALNYKADEFRKASDQDALGMQNSKFASYQNVMEKAVKLAKDAGLNIEIDQVNGRYIYTTKNGPNLIRPLSDLFTGVFANDPSIQEYYNAQAYVQRKEWIFGNANQYGGEAGAEQAYADQMIQGMQAMFGQMEEDITFQKDMNTGQKSNLEDRITKEGTIPNSPLARQYQALNEYEQQIDATGKVIENTNGYIKNVQDPALRRAMGANLDKVMASFLLQGDITGAAETLAYKDYSVKMEADPYALENVKQSNRLALAERKFQYDIALEKYKLDPEAWEKKQMENGDIDQNIPNTVDDVTGASEVNLDDDGAAVVFEDMMKEGRTDFSASERILIKDYITRVKIASEKETKDGTGGIASEDLVAFADAMIREIDTQEKYTTFDVENTPEITDQQRSEYKGRVRESWDSLSKAEQVRKAQEFDFDKYLTADYASGLSGTAVDNIFDSKIRPIIPKNEDEDVQRSYLGDWYKNSGTLNNLSIIDHKEQVLDDLNNWFTTENANVLTRVKNDPEFDEYSPYLDYYFDENFKPRDVGEFAKAYYKDNPGSENNPDEFKRLMTAYYGKDDPMLYTWMDPRVIEEGTSGSGFMKTILFGVASQLLPDDLLSPSDDPERRPIPSGEGLMKVWRNGFHRYASPDGGAMYLGLMGNDSYAARGLNYPRVDPIAIKSGATMNVMSFFSDVLGASTGDIRLTLEGPQAEMEDVEHKADLMPIFNQLYQDMFNMASPKEGNRPVLNVTYQDIAGGTRDWTALNIKFNEPYMKEYLGSDANKGIFRGIQEELRTTGMTLYLKKEGATNGFAQSKTSLEHDLYWSGQHEIKGYPDVLDGVKFTSNKNGGFDLTGNMYDGLNKEGKVMWTTLNDYFEPGISPDVIKNRFINEFAPAIQPAYEDEMQFYINNHPDYTTDPSQL